MTQHDKGEGMSETIEEIEALINDHLCELLVQFARDIDDLGLLTCAEVMREAARRLDTP